jgi:hypothetical protein
MREGTDIHVEATVPLVDAILGADIKCVLPTCDMATMDNVVRLRSVIMPRS